MAMNRTLSCLLTLSSHVVTKGHPYSNKNVQVCLSLFDFLSAHNMEGLKES